MPNKKNLPKFIITISTIIVIGTLFGAVFYLLNQTKALYDVKQLEQSQNQDDKIFDNSEDKNNENEIDTSDWKTYRNEEYRFEIRYPENWIIKESSEKMISLYPSKTSVSKKIFNGIVINIDTKDKINALLNNYLNKNILVNPYSQPQEFKKFSELFPDYEIVKIGGTDGIKSKKVISAIEAQDQKAISVILFRKGNIIEITGEEEYESTLNQILPTFKFIEN